jgi:hypothetical protein
MRRLQKKLGGGSSSSSNIILLEGFRQLQQHYLVAAPSTIRRSTTTIPSTGGRVVRQRRRLPAATTGSDATCCCTTGGPALAINCCMSPPQNPSSSRSKLPELPSRLSFSLHWRRKAQGAESESKETQCGCAASSSERASERMRPGRAGRRAGVRRCCYKGFSFTSVPCGGARQRNPFSRSSSPTFRLRSSRPGSSISPEFDHTQT